VFNSYKVNLGSNEIDVLTPFHIACFMCTNCKAPFGDNSLDNIMVQGGKVYDTKCYNELFGKKCGSCQSFIEGDLLEALGQFWHPEHLACESCQEPLANKPLYTAAREAESESKAGDMVLCSGCFFERDTRTCHACNRKIGQSAALTTGGLLYHRSCYVCCQADCPHSSTELYFGRARGTVSLGYLNPQLEQYLYCLVHWKEFCATKCAACALPMLDEVWEFHGKGYHPRCCQCSECHCALFQAPVADQSGVYFLDPVSGEASAAMFCQQHYGERVLEKCAVCKLVVASGGVQFGALKLHRACVTCRVCKIDLSVDKKNTPFLEEEGSDKVIYCLDHLPRAAGVRRGLPMCYVCETPLRRTGNIAVKGMKLHRECMKCGICNVPLDGQLFMRDMPPPAVDRKQLICQMHAEEEKVKSELSKRAKEQEAEAKGAPKLESKQAQSQPPPRDPNNCAVCATRLLGQVMKIKEHKIHKSCLFCSTCKAELTPQMKMSDYPVTGNLVLYCPLYFKRAFAPECHQCGNKIMYGPMVAIQDHKYHKSCLYCLCCHCPFVANRVAVDKKLHQLYCPTCFTIALASYGAEK